MDWITGIQRAVNYVEEHITESIDYEEAAKQAYSSSFHFQRIFGILCGFTLGDYIRMRRLSLAGRELSSSGIRVIDAALKYGYDTPESFSRAFVRFHGVSPSQARMGGVALKFFSPLFVKLILDGGNRMNYRMETKDAFQLVCKKLRDPHEAEMTTEQIIKRFWQECIDDGTILALSNYITEKNIFGNCIVGASFGKDAAAEFPYAIGVHYDGKPVTDAGLTVEEVPAHTYMVFTCEGRMPEAFMRLYQQIYSEFFPTSAYKPCGGTDFEAYPSADVLNPCYTCEMWVAVDKNGAADDNQNKQVRRNQSI